MNIPHGKASWIDNLQFDQERESALTAEVGKFRNCTIKPDGGHYAVLDRFRMKRGRSSMMLKTARNMAKNNALS